MSGLRRLFHLRSWGPRVDEGVSWELDHHLDERIDELMARGLSRESAREEALRTFGDLARVRGELLQIDRRGERRRIMGRFFDDLVQDVRYGLRGIGRAPTIAIGVVLTLALGIGATASMFSVVDALLLRPLPYAQPDELFDVFVVTPPNGMGLPYLPYDVARDWQQSQTRPVLLHARGSVLHTGGAEAETITVQAVSPEFNKVFGVEPVLGRGFLPEDADPASPDVVLLDHAFWETLGGQADVLGRTVELDGVRYVVIGVMPEGFRFPIYSTTAAWVPLRADGSALGRPARGTIEATMRVPAAAHGAVTAQATSLGGAFLRAQDPSSQATLQLQPLDGRRGGGEALKQAMLLLSAAVTLILLVAGVNMTNLLLARGSARADEMAVRTALGARRNRIVRQIATEALLLALLGGLAAVLVALLVIRALHGIMPQSITFFAPHAIAIEQRTLLFTFAVAVASGLAFGLVPAFSAAGRSRAAETVGLTRYATGTVGKRRLRGALVVVEVAFAVMLLITASLLINSFVRLMRVDPGMQLDNMAVLQFGPSSILYPTPELRGAYLRRLEARIEAVPAVQAATLTGGLPPHVSFWFGTALEPEGSPPPASDPGMLLPFTAVRPDFFDVTGARLLAGRAFQRTDDPNTSVIIDEDLARHLWPSKPAVGRRFRRDPEGEWLTVIGVIADLRLMGPDERVAEFSMLLPAGSYDRLDGQLAMAIRTRGDPDGVLNAIRRAIREVDPQQPIGELSTATSYYATAVELPRFLALLMGILAALALALAAVGVHGVLAFGVAQRRQELGIRMVLGARPAELYRLVVGEGLALAGVGVVLGITGALLSTRIVRGTLYGVDALDPATYLAAIPAVLLVAAVATLRPARRAAGVEPLETIRVQ